MLSLRALNQVRTGIIKNTKPAITTLFKSHYHSFHEDNASVIPNIVETASASFKVKKKKENEMIDETWIADSCHKRKTQRKCKN